MTQAKTFSSPEEAHRHFSASCFNRTWDLLDLPVRTAAETDEMIQTCLASIWHWSQRADCTDRERSIGAWQASRVYAVAGQGENSLHYAQLAVEYARDLAPFYLAYAFEALARAEAVLGNREAARLHHDQAATLTAKVTDAADRGLLEADLKNIPNL